MDEIESRAVDLIGQIINQIPKDGLKSINLYWECVSSEYMPNLMIRFKDEPKITEGPELAKAEWFKTKLY